MPALRPRVAALAIAVDGYPADSVDYALSKVVKPSQVDLVIAGIDQGANLGPFVDLSGTVGAARAAAAQGLPALATSEGTISITDFADGVRITLAVQNLNIPQCSPGAARGIAGATSTASLAAGVNPFVTVDCRQTTAAGADEVTAFLAGFATLTKVPLSPGG